MARIEIVQFAFSINRLPVLYIAYSEVHRKIRAQPIFILRVCLNLIRADVGSEVGRGLGEIGSSPHQEVGPLLRSPPICSLSTRSARWNDRPAGVEGEC